MAMSKKHYESIAKQINKTLEQYSDVTGIRLDAGKHDFDPYTEAARVVDRLVDLKK